MRLATHDDMPSLLRMAGEFSKVAGLDMDSGSVEHTLSLLMESGGLFVTGEPVHGMAGGLIYQNYFNRSRMAASELFWWVDPEHRKGGAGRDLLDGLEGWAKANGADTLTMVALDVSDGGSIGRFYEANGYKPLERHYAKVL